jgi:hypothetical protein
VIVRVAGQAAFAPGPGFGLVTGTVGSPFAAAIGLTEHFGV